MSNNEEKKELVSESEWSVGPSSFCTSTVNPIRAIVDKLQRPPSTPQKPLIPLSIGDPTVFGNLNPPSEAIESIVNALKSGKYNGYAHSTGRMEAKQAVAKYYHRDSTNPVAADDVILTSGCSGAVAIAIPALASPGDNILIPKPGFSLYQTVSGHYGINVKHYNLLPEKSWECDLSHMASLIDPRTRAILINNPSNPNGSNYSKQHLLEILAFAEKYRLPIIADEIYADMVFAGQVFHSLSSLSTEVPVLTLGGLAKQFVVPGWRMGWLIINDRKHRLKRVRQGCVSLSQVILGPNTVFQMVLPDILHHVNPSFFTDLMGKLEAQAMTLVKAMQRVPGLRVIVPQGAMYVMVQVESDKFQDLPDGTVFAQKLLQEELLEVLPGDCFGAPDFFRLVFCAPTDIMAQAAQRMLAFCRAHLKPEFLPKDPEA